MHQILFICLHGSAKSLIATEHFNRLADAAGLDVRAASFGVEPDETVPPPVIQGLAADGIDVHAYVPRAIDADAFLAATRVISFGCEPSALPGGRSDVEGWNDLPMVSDGFDAARTAIVARVTRLIDSIASS
jgi:arsenate reductase (thioredoxin)